MDQAAYLHWLRLEVHWDGQRISAGDFDRELEELAANLTGQRSAAADVLRVMEEELRAGAEWVDVKLAAATTSPEACPRVTAVVKYHQHRGERWWLLDAAAPDWLKEWVAANSPETAFGMARHGQLPPGLAAKLCGRTEQIDEALAKNPSTPREVLERLLEKGPKVRLRLAEREPVEEWLLQTLVKDSYLPVRERLARSPAPLWLYELLADDPDAAVRLHLAGNWRGLGRNRGAAAVVRKLWRDPEPQVVVAAVHAGLPLSPQEQVELARHPSHQVRGQLAIRRLKPEAIAILIGDADASVRAGVARHQELSIEQASHLAKDEELTVRRALAGSQRCPLRVLRLLARDPDEKTRAAAGRSVDAILERLGVQM